MRGLLVLAMVLGCDDGAGSIADPGEGDMGGGDTGVVGAVPCPSEVPEGWVCAPAGTFTMGANREDPSKDDDEVQHEVTLTRPFLVRIYEVTQLEWTTLMGNNPSWFGNEGGVCAAQGCDDLPVERVSYFDALAWLNAASREEGLTPCYDLGNCGGEPGSGCEEGEQQCLAGYTCSGSVDWDQRCDGYRLPTEAEWEYMARAGSTQTRYGILDDIAWYTSTASLRSHRVGNKAPNNWGIYDTLGNVAEWCWDRYDRSYGTFQPDRNPQTDPLGAEFGDTRVLRGCAWTSGNRFCRLPARENDFSAQHSSALGFRAVRTVIR